MTPAAKAVMLAGLLLAALAALVVLYLDEPWTPLRVAGLALVLPSAGLWIVARVQLGASFAVRPQAGDLVTRGLYARIRHPLYVFGGLAWLGAILFTARLEFLPLLAVIAAVQVVRIRREERALEAHFGEAYRAYRRATWF